MEIEIAAAVVLLFLLTFLATIDMAFVQVSDLGLRRLTSDTEDNERVNTPFLRGILENRPRFRFALSAAIQIVLITFSILTTLIALRFFAGNRVELFFVSLAAGVVSAAIFRQLIPRLVTFGNPQKTLILLLPFVRPFYGAFAFIADPFGNLNRDKTPLETTILPSRDDDEETTDEDDNDSMQTFLEAGEAEGIIEEDERELIESMVEFGDTVANEVMTPRTEIEAISIESTVREARDAIIESKYSRLPVYRDQIENIEGVIYVRDLLQFWAEDKADARIEDLKNLLRPVYFVPETKSVADLLKEMQKARAQIAIVIDEYGGVAGLVTVEDILEELVGEIEDEDTEQEEIIEIIENADNSYDVLGSTEIGKIEDLFDMEIEDDDFTTVAGLVISELGYVPKIGEQLNFRGIDAEILQADEKRINLLRLRRTIEQNDSEKASTE